MEKYSEKEERQKKVDALVLKIRHEADKYLCRNRMKLKEILSKDLLSEKDISMFNDITTEYYFLLQLMEYVSVPGVFMEYERYDKSRDMIVYTIPIRNINIFLHNEFNFVSSILSDISIRQEKENDFSFKILDVFTTLRPCYFANEFLTALDYLTYGNE